MTNIRTVQGILDDPNRTPGEFYITPTHTIVEAEQAMAHHGVSAIVVADFAPEGGWVIMGIVSEKDIAHAIVSKDFDPNAFVTSIMTPNPITTTPDALVGNIADQMLKEHISHLPVVNSNGCFLGTISDRDVLSAFVDALQGEVAGLASLVWWQDLRNGQT